jgi:hypothetical protein
MVVEGVEEEEEEIVAVEGDDDDDGYGSIELSDGAQILRSWMSSRTVSFHRWPVV